MHLNKVPASPAGGLVPLCPSNRVVEKKPQLPTRKLLPFSKTTETGWEEKELGTPPFL